MSFDKDEVITYQVTLKGYWDNPEKRLWKSGRDIYHVDMNNNAKLIQSISLPSSVNDDVSGKDFVAEEYVADIEKELDAIFDGGDNDEEMMGNDKGFYDIDESGQPLKKKTKRII
jgi:hypothetical protein